MVFLSMAIAVLFTPAGSHAAPGGDVVDAISDEFDTLKAMWTPGLRGMPEVLTIQDGILSIRSVDNGDDPYPSAEDMICTYADQIGRSLNAAERPGVVAWVWLPPFGEWPAGTNASGLREWFGLRVTAYDSGMPYYGGLYWPGIYVATDDDGPCLIARAGDGFGADVTIGRINQAGWWTLGLSWNRDGRTEYYAAPGRVALTDNDRLYTPPIYEIPEANRSMDELDGTFVALRMTYPSSGLLSPDWMVDSIRVHVKPTPVAGDFNDDGKPDYLLFNPATRRTVIWYMDGPARVSSALSPILPAGWSLAATADFDGDYKPNYLLFNAATRQTRIWYIDGTAHISAIGPTLPVGWSIVAAADFNGDEWPDLLIFNSATRQTRIWHLNGNTRVSSAISPTLPADWFIVAASDFNGDDKPDIVLLNGVTSQTSIWYMDGPVRTSNARGPVVPAGWSIAAAADFNGDAHPDFLLFHSATRKTAIWYMNGPLYLGSSTGPTLPGGWTLAGR